MTADGRGTATVLFTDIVGSTELRVRAGDLVADELFVRFERLLGQLVEAHDGTVVKGLGDGIMATFNRSADGVLAAMEMQRRDAPRGTARAPTIAGSRSGSESAPATSPGRTATVTARPSSPRAASAAPRPAVRSSATISSAGSVAATPI